MGFINTLGLYPTPYLLSSSSSSSSYSNSRNNIIVCGQRSTTRKPLWRSDLLSTEAIQAVQSLKLAKSSPRLQHVLDTKLSRLLKGDLLNTLSELHRQNQLNLALLIFRYIQKEEWYEPDLALYSDMIRLLGKNKMIGMAEEFFSELKKEGLEPDASVYTEMIGACLRAGMVEKAMLTYEQMKESSCVPNEFTLTVLIKNLVKLGEEPFAERVRKDCAEYLESPEKFLEEIDERYPRRRSLDLV